ncbi:peptidase S41, partial [Aquimarina celericrescens]|nr:peptidase S41 [Aquimarina celericrescens]
MKNKITHLFLLVFSVSLLTSCFEDQDDDINPASVDDIKDFIYRGLDIFYLYKGDIPILAEDISEEAVTQFKNNYSTPENFFEALLSPDDRFSVIYSDYRVLENNLDGITLNNGMEYGLVSISNTNDVFGYVRYVLPNTSAESEGVTRGMIFNRIDGTALSVDNFRELLAPNTYTIGLANFEAGTLTPLEETITLTKQEYTENPVHIVNTIELENNQKVGYLMYNAFNRNFDNDLNNAFSQFQAENITDLVVDLRYNGGGSIETSNDLASMITG